MFKIKADDLWDYSLAAYSKNSVKHACLTLQDTMQINVNLVLSMMYLCHHQRMYEFDDIVQLEQAIAPIENKLAEHRAKRRALKSISQERYKQALDEELVLEKQQQHLLVEKANTLEFGFMLSPDYLCDQLSALCWSRIIDTHIDNKQRALPEHLTQHNTLPQSVIDACETIAKHV